MAEKRIMVVNSDLCKKIDESRGDMSQTEFLEFLLDMQLRENNRLEEKKQREDLKVYATKEELHSFEADIKKLLKNFLDFYVTYGLELGKPSLTQELDGLAGKLKGLDKEMGLKDEKKVTIKYR
jgi:hypothetical protein